MDWNRQDTLLDTPALDRHERRHRPATEDPDSSGLLADLEAVAQLDAELAAGTPAEVVGPPHQHPRLSTTAWDLSDSEPTAPPPLPHSTSGFRATSTFDGRKTSVWCPPAAVRASATAALYAGRTLEPVPTPMPRPPRRAAATMLPPLPGGPARLPPPQPSGPHASAAAPRQVCKPAGVPMSYRAFRAVPHQPVQPTAMIRLPSQTPRRSLLARIRDFFARLFGRGQ